MKSSPRWLEETELNWSHKGLDLHTSWNCQFKFLNYGLKMVLTGLHLTCEHENNHNPKNIWIKPILIKCKCCVVASRFLLWDSFVFPFGRLPVRPWLDFWAGQWLLMSSPRLPVSNTTTLLNPSLLYHLILQHVVCLRGCFWVFFIVTHDSSVSISCSFSA